MGARISFVLLIFAGVAAAQTTVRSAPITREFPIDSILIEGNRILPAAGILAASGLKRGETGGAAAFDAARDRLLASGYFETVSYHFRPSPNTGFEVTFEVREVAALYPIRVDALPVSAQELNSLLRMKDPLFTGKMPGTKAVIDRSARSIEEFLEMKKQPMQVAGKVIAATPEQFEIDFTPARGVPAVASVSFEGSKAIGATDLHNKMGEVAFGQPYTENGFRVLLDNQIRSMYEAKGYMRVTFPQISAEPSAQVQGVDVKVTVNEGEQFRLSKVVVEGPMAGDSARILKAARFPQMKVADADQIKEGAARVKESMRHQGFLDAAVSVERKLDDREKSVEFTLLVNPGPEYTFGKLTVNGLGLDGEAAIRKMWSVGPGSAFPAEYPDYFLAKVKEEGLFDNLGDMKAHTDIGKDSHVVDVLLDFKGAPQPPKTFPPRR